MTRDHTAVRSRASDDRGFGQTIQVMILAVVAVAFVLLLTLAGRSAEARNRVGHAAESAAQAAALQRTPTNAADAATRVATAGLTNCGDGPEIAVDTSGRAPGGIVAVTITCQVRTRDLAPLPLPGRYRMRVTGAAVIDAYRSAP